MHSLMRLQSVAKTRHLIRGSHPSELTLIGFTNTVAWNCSRVSAGVGQIFPSFRRLSMAFRPHLFLHEVLDQSFISPWPSGLGLGESEHESCFTLSGATRPRDIRIFGLFIAAVHVYRIDYSCIRSSPSRTFDSMASSWIH